MHWVNDQKDGLTSDAVDDVCFQSAGTETVNKELAYGKC